jgi:hypothetical protein
VHLNGVEYRRAFVDHAALIQGGELTFATADEPVMSWGVAPDARPRSSVEATVAGAPFISRGARTFRGTQEVSIGTAEPDAEIRYTLDGSAPGSTSNRYQRPITISDSVMLHAMAVRGDAVSPTVAVAFRRLTDYPKIELSAPYAPQYAAAGNDTLIDGLRGNESFRTGRWQGYRGTDLTVTLDFGEQRQVRHVAMGFVQDIGAWILMPRRVVVEASDDGKRFQALGVLESSVPERESKAVNRDFVLDLERPRLARYVRLRVETFGPLPAWHPGAGEQAWFFADEVVVR